MKKCSPRLLTLMPLTFAFASFLAFAEPWEHSSVMSEDYDDLAASWQDQDESDYSAYQEWSNEENEEELEASYDNEYDEDLEDDELDEENEEYDDEEENEEELDEYGNPYDAMY